MCRTQSNTTRQELSNSNQRRCESGERNTRLTSCPLASLELSFDTECSDCRCHCLIGCLKETQILDEKLQRVEKNDVIFVFSKNTFSRKISLAFPDDFIQYKQKDHIPEGKRRNQLSMDATCTSCSLIATHFFIQCVVCLLRMIGRLRC